MSRNGLKLEGQLLSGSLLLKALKYMGIAMALIIAAALIDHVTDKAQFVETGLMVVAIWPALIGWWKLAQWVWGLLARGKVH